MSDQDRSLFSNDDDAFSPAGRGGSGGIRSHDPRSNDVPGDFGRDTTFAVGRGGAGNISADDFERDENTPAERSFGRGGAGNITHSDGMYSTGRGGVGGGRFGDSDSPDLQDQEERKHRPHHEGSGRGGVGGTCAGDSVDPDQGERRDHPRHGGMGRGMSGGMRGAVMAGIGSVRSGMENGMEGARSGEGPNLDQEERYHDEGNPTGGRQARWGQ